MRWMLYLLYLYVYARSVIEGALATAVLYFVGSTATAVVGPRFLLAAFLGGGVFAQRETHAPLLL